MLAQRWTWLGWLGQEGTWEEVTSEVRPEDSEEAMQEAERPARMLLQSSRQEMVVAGEARRSEWVSVLFQS